MQKYYTFFIYSFIVNLVLTIQSLTVLAQKAAVVQPPLNQCWSFNAEGIDKNELASDNVSQIFFSYQDGVVTAVNIDDGNQNWKTELSGNILSIIYQDEIVYVVSLNETSDTITLRSLGASTGITNWQKALKVSVSADHRISLLQSNEFLFLLTDSGDLYKFLKEDGREIEKISIMENVTTKAVMREQEILFGTDKKNLILYSIPGKTISKIHLDNIPTGIYAEAERIIISDKLGKITSIKAKNNKKEWQTRVGAEVSDITKTEKGFAVSSNDNFIYLITSDNGGKRWKRRFNGRTSTTVSVNDKSEGALVAVSLNSSDFSLLNPNSGKTVNQIVLPSSGILIGKPFSFKDLLIFKTSAGLVSYSAGSRCAKNEKPESDSGF